MEIIDTFWFNGPLGTVGLVIGDNGHELKAYTASLGHSIRGQAIDTARVASMGAPFPLAAALAISPAAQRRQANYKRQAPAGPVDQAPAALGPGQARHISRAELDWPECGCSDDDRTRCYFIRPLGRPGCIHAAAQRADLAKDDQAPADPPDQAPPAGQ